MKSSANLSEPGGFVDLHSHVLPGLDHGAQNEEEAVELLTALSEMGFKKVVGTPHFDSSSFQPDRETLTRTIAKLEPLLANHGPELFAGTEVPFDDNFSNIIERGTAPSIGQSETYLVEFGMFPGSVPIRAAEMLFKLRLSGRQMIVAHPERIPDFQRDLDKLVSIRRGGALLQVNLMSLVGRYGRDAQKTVVEILENDYADLASSDLHHISELPSLERAMERLADQSGEQLRRLVSTNPGLVLDGKGHELVENA